MDPTEIPLRDIHLPEPISWWPLAPAWWILLAVLGLLVAAAAIGVWRRRKTRVQRAACAELERIEQAYSHHQDPHRLARELSKLTKRLIRTARPDTYPNATTEAQFTAQLGAASDVADIDPIIARTLLRAPYRPGEHYDAAQLLAAMRAWLKGVYVAPGSAT